MRTSRLRRLLVAASLCIPAAVSAVVTPTASAEPCPDVQVVFARGTVAPPGLSPVGQAFVDGLRSRLGGKSIGVYAVDYPASLDFEQSTTDGAANASGFVQNVVATCPNTRIVLSGYSQGADVIDLITADAGTAAWGTPAPMPPSVADHVAAVVLFGNPSARLGGGPITATSSLYGSKAIDLCITGDPICSEGGNLMAHTLYLTSGVADQGAAFAAGRL